MLPETKMEAVGPSSVALTEPEPVTDASCCTLKARFVSIGANPVKASTEAPAEVDSDPIPDAVKEPTPRMFNLA